MNLPETGDFHSTMKLTDHKSESRKRTTSRRRRDRTRIQLSSPDHACFYLTTGTERETLPTLYPFFLLSSRLVPPSPKSKLEIRRGQWNAVPQVRPSVCVCVACVAGRRVLTHAALRVAGLGIAFCLAWKEIHMSHVPVMISSGREMDEWDE